MMPSFSLENSTIPQSIGYGVMTSILGMWFTHKKGLYPSHNAIFCAQVSV